MATQNPGILVDMDRHFATRLRPLVATASARLGVSVSRTEQVAAEAQEHHRWRVEAARALEHSMKRAGDLASDLPPGETRSSLIASLIGTTGSDLLGPRYRDAEAG